MKASTTKRLFKAVAAGATPELVELCKKIIAEEEHKGHTVLSRQLSAILDSANTSKSVDRGEKVHSLGEFALNNDKVPISRRFKDPLVRLIPRDELRHHLVLPAEVAARYERVVREYSARHRLAKYGLNYKKKILIYGPPGCGKTLSAEFLAWNTGLPLIKVRFDALISSYFGESAANLRNVFEWASHTPSVLFLDECDFLAKSRTANNDIGEVVRIVNTLLTLLEEYDSPGLLLAATNLTDSLDKALFRRFDEVFEVPKPGAPEIERLLSLTLESMPLDRNLNFADFTDKFAGLPASAIVSVARDAAASVVIEGHARLSAHDLEIALKRIQGSLIK